MPIHLINGEIKETKGNQVAYGIALTAGLVTLPAARTSAASSPPTLPKPHGFDALGDTPTPRFFVVYDPASMPLSDDIEDAEVKDEDAGETSGRKPLLSERSQPMSLQDQIDQIGRQYPAATSGSSPSPEIHVLIELPKGALEKVSSLNSPANPQLHIHIMDKLDGFARHLKGKVVASRKFALDKTEQELAPPPAALRQSRSDTGRGHGHGEETGRKKPSQLMISLGRFSHGLSTTLKNHWFRIVAPTVFLGLFLLFPIPLGAASLWPDATAWLLGNVLSVVLIPTITFAVGYLLFQLSQQFSIFDKTNPKWNTYHVLHNVSRFLMWSAVGFGLFAALFTPAIPAFLQAAVIGNGINSGFVTQLFSFNVLGLLPLLGIVALAGALGIFLTKWAAPAFKTLGRDEIWRGRAIYWISKLGVTLVYASAFTAVFLSVASLSMAITMAAGGSAALGLGIGFMLTVGPVLAKVAAQVGKLTGWIGAYAEMMANFLGTLKLPAIHFASGIRALFNSKVDPWPALDRARTPVSSEPSASGEAKGTAAAKMKADEAKAITAKQEDYTNEIRENGPQSKTGKALLWTYNLVTGIFVVAFRVVSVALSEMNQMFEVLEGKLLPAKEIAHNPRDQTVYHQTVDNYDPLLGGGLSYHGDPAKVGHPFDAPLWCWDSQKEMATRDVLSRAQLTHVYTTEADRTLVTETGPLVLPVVGAA